MDPRTCRNCACVYKIERPAIMPANMDKREFDTMPKEQWVCRLNPPMIANTPKGPALVQMPTNPESVCWHWVPEDFLPGEHLLPTPHPPER